MRLRSELSAAVLWGSAFTPQAFLVTGGDPHPGKPAQFSCNHTENPVVNVEKSSAGGGRNESTRDVLL